MHEFADLFRGKEYHHRNPTQSDYVAQQLYEDLYALGNSPQFINRVDAQKCVLNTSNKITGKTIRRGDGTFGQLIPEVAPQKVAGFSVYRGPTADVQIGVEVKVLATAMGKQIDRVVNDLEKQAKQFRSVSPDAITVAIVGVNHSTTYTAYDGDKVTTKPNSKDPAPVQEAPGAMSTVQSSVGHLYDELLFLSFDANNTDPFPFSWANAQRVQNEYNSLLVRVSSMYTRRFP